MATKKLTDYDGKEYIFSCEKFHKAISNQKIKLQMQNKCTVSRAFICEELSNRLHVSFDTVRNWDKGKNGTGLEEAKKIAEYFEIDYHELLNTFEEYTRPSQIKENDRKLVESVFQKSLSVLIERINFVPTDNDVNKQIQYRQNRENAINKLRDIHLFIHCHSLSTSVTIRNALLKLVLETEALVFDDDPETWNKYAEYGCFKCGDYYGYERSAIIKDGEISARCYILDELDFAEYIGLDNIKTFDDRFYELDNGDLEEFATYGYHGDLDITSNMVYEYHLTQYLTDVYKKVFEELF